MAAYKEIVTKTIVGKGKKSFEKEYNLTTEEKPNTVLGCWIINHRFKGSNRKNEVKVNGSFDVNVKRREGQVPRAILYNMINSIEWPTGDEYDIVDHHIRSYNDYNMLELNQDFLEFACHSFSSLVLPNQTSNHLMYLHNMRSRYILREAGPIHHIELHN